MKFDLLHEVEIAADPRKVFDALATSRGLASFWTARSTVPAAIGGVATFGFPDAPAAFEFRVDALEPGKRVAWTSVGEFPPPWKGTTVTWDLRAKDGRTVVLFRHGNWMAEFPEEAIASINYTWGQVVARLKAYCESGTAQPFFA